MIFRKMYRKCFAKKSFWGRILLQAGEWNLVIVAVIWLTYITSSLFFWKLAWWGNKSILTLSKWDQGNKYCKGDKLEDIVLKLLWMHAWFMEKTLCIGAKCRHAWGYLIRFNLMIYHMYEKNNWYRLW